MPATLTTTINKIQSVVQTFEFKFTKDHTIVW